MSATARRAAEATLRAADGEERLILATGKYLGEGFDDARLDTLFIAMPISWKGTLAQYVGRLHREHGGKKDVCVYDYVDVEVPVLARMGARRKAGYRALGYQLHSVTSAPLEDNAAANALSDSDDRPSSVFDRYWIYAERSHPDTYPRHSKSGGKWMLFVNKGEVDDWWAKIKAATERGDLGSSAKVATMKENPNAASKDTKVICVYTYDVNDASDCSRVRQRLRDLGVTWKIPYKTDADTIAGKYSKADGVRVSKRYE